MSEYQWKTVRVVGFDDLMAALENAERYGYMPDAVREQWEGFNWEPSQRTWVGLTDEEINDLVHNHDDFDGLWEFTDAVEAKLKEKNT